MTFPLAMTLLLASAATFAADGKPAPDVDEDEAALSVSEGRDSSHIRISSAGNKAVIDVKSDSGIGRAKIARKSDRWPKAILVRMHLRGLESFKVNNGDTTLNCWCASGAEKKTYASLIKGNVESTLDKESPFWAEVRIVGRNRKIPLDEGYFEIPLPAKLFETNPKEIKLSWVDFFRE